MLGEVSLVRPWQGTFSLWLGLAKSQRDRALASHGEVKPRLPLARFILAVASEAWSRRLVARSSLTAIDEDEASGIEPSPVLDKAKPR